LVQNWLHTPFRLTNDRMRDVTMPGGPFRLALAEGQFPILPWLTFYLAGTVAGHLIVRDRPGLIAGLGVAFLSVGGFGHLLYKAGALPMSKLVARRAFGLQLGFFPASVAIATLLLGGALLLIALMVWFERKYSLSDNNPMVTLGRASLTLLMIHVPLFRDLSRPIGLWRGLSAEAALATIFIFFGLAAVVTRVWQRVGYKYGAEWALRKAGGS
jgi:peptidoglycan/LPS O-acetylase OafA/YrhL